MRSSLYDVLFCYFKLIIAANYFLFLDLVHFSRRALIWILLFFSPSCSSQVRDQKDFAIEDLRTVL